LHLDECYELDGKGEYEDDDSHVYVVRWLLLMPKSW
jgi:hypothetical protein